MSTATKDPIVDYLERSQDGFHGFTVFLLGVGIVFLFLTLTRLTLGVLSCLDIMFNGAFKKSSQKLDAAKERGKKDGKKKKKEKRSTKSSSKSSKSASSKSGSKNVEGLSLPAISKKNEKSSGTKFKEWKLEKRRAPLERNTKSSNSSTINATSIDLLAAPKHALLSTAPAPAPSTSASTRVVTFDNVPEPASNTAYKYASIAATWPGTIPLEPVPKLYKSDDCPTPNPFKDPSLNIPIATTPPNALETAIIKAPDSAAGDEKPEKVQKSGDDSKKGKVAGADDNSVAGTKRSSRELAVYAPNEVPVQFETENVKTAVEISSTNNSPAKKIRKTPTKQQHQQASSKPSQTVIAIPESPAFSIQSTPQATSDTQNSLTLQSPTQKTAEEKKQL